MEETLNQLMAEKKKNEEQAKTEFDKRVKETKAKAIQENIKLANETGNKLTQMLATDGETLVDAKPKLTNDSVGGGIWNAGDESSSVTMTVEEMRKELFESDDVVMDKKNDHGLSRLSSSGAPEAKEMDNVD
jgi:paraquat-inducible protein B